MTTINHQKYKELKSKIAKAITNFEAYDTEEHTTPEEVDELFAKSEHFVEWLISLLEKSGEIALHTMEDEGIYDVTDDKVRCPACGVTGIGHADCSCPVAAEVVNHD